MFGKAMAIRNLGVVHGEWGENVATAALRLEGYVIVERNVRPCAWDRRLEIDIVAYDRAADAMVFVEVKQHSSHCEGESRIRSVNARKLGNLRKACGVWRHQSHWRGAVRFDVVEVFGEPGRGKPEVDHVRGVRLFVPSCRFVEWEGL